MFFQTKRERRGKIIQRRSKKKWSELLNSLSLVELGFDLSTTDDHVPKKKSRLIKEWLDEADKRGEYANRLDRHLGLRTDQEDREYQEHWRTERNKVYICFAILAFAISIISLGFSISTYLNK